MRRPARPTCPCAHRPPLNSTHRWPCQTRRGRPSSNAFQSRPWRPRQQAPRSRCSVGGGRRPIGEWPPNPRHGVTCKSKERESVERQGKHRVSSHPARASEAPIKTKWLSRRHPRYPSQRALLPPFRTERMSNVRPRRALDRLECPRDRGRAGAVWKRPRAATASTGQRPPLSRATSGCQTEGMRRS